MSALNEIAPSTVGKIEIFRIGHYGADVRFKFAGEIAAAAMLRHKKRKTPATNIEYIVSLAVLSLRYAVWSVHSITEFYLYRRFSQ